MRRRLRATPRAQAIRDDIENRRREEAPAPEETAILGLVSWQYERSFVPRRLTITIDRHSDAGFSGC
jgi:hypothetical protein